MKESVLSFAVRITMPLWLPVLLLAYIFGVGVGKKEAK